MGGVQDAIGVLDDFRDAASNGQGLGGRAARAACDAWAGSPSLRGGSAVSNKAANVAMGYGCEPYWSGPDGYDPPTQPPDEPPFTGGQCDGVPYRVRVRRTNPDLGFVMDHVNNPITGPIASATISPSGKVDEIAATRTLTVVGKNGTFVDSQVISVNEGQNLFVVVTRADGQPDNCGDPEGEPVNPLPGNPPPGRPGYGDPVDVGEPGAPYPIIIGPPVIGPTGQPVFPIEGPTGTEPFSPTDPNAPLPTEPPAIGEPIDVSGGGEEDSEDPEDNEDGEFIGYEWEVLGDEDYQSVIPGSDPTVYSRIVGSIQLKLRGAGSRTFYGHSLRIRAKRGTIVTTDKALDVVGVAYTSLPDLGGLRLREIRRKRNDC